jgi:hypothetical protein
MVKFGFKIQEQNILRTKKTSIIMGLFNWKKKEENSKNIINPNNPKQESSLDEFTQQMADSAILCVNHFKDRYGDKLDFSVQSLETIDTILDEASDFYEEMKQEQKEWIINSVGSYIFEVARRNYGGKYFWLDQRNQPIFVTGQPKFEISIVVFDKVKGRMENGKEDNIPFFFQGYTERVEKAKEGDRATIV